MLPPVIAWSDHIRDDAQQLLNDGVADTFVSIAPRMPEALDLELC